MVKNMICGFYYVVPTILILYIVRKYRESKWGNCTNNVRLHNKVAIVTGANSGLGLEIAKELASRDAHVILACRSLEKAQQACLQVRLKTSGDVQVVPMEVDLGSLKSIKRFANEIKSKFKTIHLLINNAGVSYPNHVRLETVDKFEMHFGVNYLGHFYLTNLLLDQLSASSSRVVVVASSLHERGKIILDDLNGLHPTKKNSLYSNSKLANVYFAQELARRVNPKAVKVYACCPGWVYTGLFRHSFKWYHYFLVAPVAFFFMRTVRQGAQTPLYCATEPALENETGLLYRDCKHYNSRMIFYDNTAKQLWEKSEEMIQDALAESK